MEQGDATDRIDTTVLRFPSLVESGRLEGQYRIECRAPDGTLRWSDSIDNLVVNVGKNLMLDTILGASYTAVGPFMGLISSVGYGAGPAAADTMASHAGWVEAGNGSNFPVWTTPASNARGTLTMSAAATGSKTTSSATSFTIGATGGTIKGCFIVVGSGAVATNNNTSGTLLSAGTFSGGDRVVSPADVVNVSYTLSI